MLVFASAAGAGPAHAQSGLPLRLDPTTVSTGTTLLLTIDARSLMSGGRPAESLVAALPPGMRFDARARPARCTREQARTQCPSASRIGSGHMGVTVAGYAGPGAETELSWSIDAFVGTPVRRGDVGAVVLRSRLLAADQVGALLAPVLTGALPASTVTTARVVRPASGRYGLELRVGALPGVVGVRAPAVATPAGLDLSLGAVRRVKQAFTHVIRVRTVSGVEVQRIPDHRLVGYDLLRTPAGCPAGGWPSELRLGFAGGGVVRARAALFCSVAD